MRATAYNFTAPPQVVAGVAATATVALVGGTDLDAPLVITLSGSSIAFGGTVTINPGTPSSTTTLTASGGVGPRIVSASHTGGNAGMNDGAALVQVVGPTLAPATGYGLSVHSIPAPYQGRWSNSNAYAGRVGPEGVGHLVRLFLTGG